ncbi:MAG: ribonuclease HII [Halanaerobiales bacterium]|nr:ribonuclease HII [Halanaerobiales bacterium]
MGMELSQMTISQVQNLIKEIEPTLEMIEKLGFDQRKGIQRLGEQMERQLNRKKKLEKRFDEMLKHERQYWSQGISQIVGIDEVGRGPLAGPVVAAAVIIKPDFYFLGLNDSKKLREEEREKFFDIIMENALGVGIGIVDNREIDKINILQASFKAMKHAFDQLIEQGFKPQVAIVDGDKTVHGININQQAIVDGDAKSISIAAASVVAKVTRDRQMVKFSKEYLGYGFERNKGYGAPEHLSGLIKLGPTPIHRFSFSMVRQSNYSETYHLYVEMVKSAKELAALKEIGELIAKDKERLFEVELVDLRQVYIGMEKKLSGS